MLFIFSIGLLMSQPPESGTIPNNRPIAVEETGVATSYEATKNISCHDTQWQVQWSSRPGRGRMQGGVTVLIGGKSKVLTDAQEEIFGKFEAIDTVSASCNRGANGGPTRSSLLLLGSDEAGKKALAQLRVEPDFKASWSFNTAE
jgi:hypothetical protein